MTVGDFVVENGFWIALILWGVYMVVRVFERRDERAAETARALELQQAVALSVAVQAWGSNPAGWPSEVRDVLGVEL